MNTAQIIIIQTQQTQPSNVQQPETFWFKLGRAFMDLCLDEFSYATGHKPREKARTIRKMTGDFEQLETPAVYRREHGNGIRMIFDRDTNMLRRAMPLKD